MNSFRGDDTLCILPTFLKVEERVTSILAGTGCAVLFGSRIFTFPRLFERLWEEVPASSTLLSPVTQGILIERVIQTIYRAREGGYFAPVAGSKSLSSAISNTINTLKNCNISSDQFTDMARRWEGENREKIGELAVIYSRYQGMLATAGLADRCDRNWHVRDFVADTGNEIELLRGISHLLVEDIYDFTPVQFELIVALACRIEHTTVVIPYDHDRDDIFDPVERTIRRFEGLWDLNRDINLDFRAQRGQGSVILTMVADGYLRSDSPKVHGPVDTSGELIIMESGGIYREVEAIGREIRGLLDRGVRPSCIGVIVRDLSLYAELVEDVFRRFGIPLYLRRGKPLLSNSLVKTILSIFEVVATNFERNALTGIILSNYTAFLDDESPLLRERLESFLLTAGIIDDRADGWERRLDRLLEKTAEGQNPDAVPHRPGSAGGPTEAEAVRRIRDRILWLKGEIEAFRDNTTLEGFAASLKRLVGILGMRSAVVRGGDEFIVKRDCAALTTFEQILDTVPVVAAQLGMADQPVSCGYFRSFLLKFMEARFILAGREPANGVRVLNYYEGRGLAFDYLFLGGCSEDPAFLSGAEDPFFTEEELLQMNHLAKKKIFLMRNEKVREEPLLFYLALTSARKRLYLSYSQVDVQGRAVLPSFHLNEVKRLLGEKADRAVRVDHGLTVPPVRECLADEELVNRLALSLWRTSSGDLREAGRSLSEEEQLIAQLYNELIGIDRFQGAFKRIFYCAEVEKVRENFFLGGDLSRRKAAGSVWTGSLRQPAILEELRVFFGKGEGRLWSPTAFEFYAGCPFRFFLERVLRLYPLRKPEEEIEKVDEGALVHTVLERFFTVLKKEKRLPVRGGEGEKAILHAVADGVYREWEEGGFVGNRELWEIRKGRTAPLWDRFVEEEARCGGDGLVPTCFEFTLGEGPDRDAPPLVFAGGDGSEIAVGGKIDRIDIGGHAARIIDYKNSSGEGHYRELLKNEKMGVVNFQIPLYLAAVKEYLAQRYSLEHLEGTYYLFRKGKRLSPHLKSCLDPFYEKDVEKRTMMGERGEENLFNRMAAIVSAASSGEFAVCPQECTFCRYGNVCRYVENTPEGGEEE